MNVRAHRIQSEWEFLRRLAECNPDVIRAVVRRLSPDGTEFRCVLARTAAFVGSPPQLDILESHDVCLRFAPFFPAVPIEAFLERPVFHPNVHPDSGFVCLWDRFSSGDSTLDAVFKLQRLLAWELYNASAEHVMQPEALAWVERMLVPLAYARLRIPPELENECGYRGPVRRPRRPRLMPT